MKVLLAVGCMVLMVGTVDAAQGDNDEAMPGTTAYFLGALGDPSNPTYSSHNIICATTSGYRRWIAGVYTDKVDEDDPAQASHFGCRNLNENEVVKVSIKGVIYDKIADAIDDGLASNVGFLWWRPLAQIEVPKLGIIGYTTLENLKVPARLGLEYNTGGGVLLKRASQDVLDDARIVCDKYMKRHSGSLPSTVDGCVEDGPPIDFGTRIETGRFRVIEENPAYLYNAKVEVVDGPDKGKSGWTACWNSFAHSVYAGNKDKGLQGLQEVPNTPCMP